MTKPRKFILLACLYVAQGLPYGFFQQALPVLLRKANMSLPQIGLANLLLLPWALKFVWAPAVDRWKFPGWGLRKSWLLPLQLVSVTAFGLLSLTEPKNNLSLVMVAFLITNLIAASQDIATDGLAVDLLTHNERGWANGIQVSGYRLGMMIGGGVLLWVYEITNWPTVMITMSMIALFCTWPVFALQEPARTLRVEAKTLKEVFREIINFCLQKGARPWITILIVYKAAHYFSTGMLRPWMVDRGYTLTEIAGLIGTFSFGAGFIGAMIGGAMASKFNRQKLLIIFALLESLSVMSYIWPIWSELSTYKVAIATALDHFSSGLSTAVLFTLMMDACSKERAASDYTLQSCIVVAATGTAAALSGYSAEYFGYSAHFFISGALSLFALALTAWLIRLPSVRALLLRRDASGT
jgi:PAT family beta-lactamase induction signal transducer AmpG